MIKRAASTNGEVKITFALPAEVGPVSVVGDFNGWDPSVNPLKARSNGTRSAVLKLEKNQTYRFRYLGDGGVFFDDENADDREPNGYGDEHCLLRT
ncbi:MAG: isoamylase early set domain-containing protein [Acidimicrobiales bacterium]|jgi:1,4-alpha-glucan branching enzyme|nr:isoamylase early set domain-containing protein [Acidimicrobiales bacterium]